MKTDNATHIRWMIRSDMPAVLAIEGQCFEYPWTEDDFIFCLRQRNCIGMVAERDDKIEGFMLYELYKSKLVLMSLAVAGRSQRSGIGSAMIAKLQGKLNPTKNRIILECRETNIDALLFFKSLGFMAVGIRRGAYEETSEDAIQMAYVHKQDANAKAKNRIESWF